MVNTPLWQAATAGFSGNAGHVNQFVGTHKTSFLYSGAIQSSQQTGNSVYTSSQGTYTYQKFTTTSAQTSVGTVQLQVSAVGGSPITELISPLAVGIYNVSANIPTGSPLAAAEVLSSYVYSSSFWVTIPIPVLSLSPSTTYAIVTASAGNASHYYALQHSNQTTGGGVSLDGGLTWSIGNYGFMYRIYDTSVGSSAGSPAFVYDDDGARWVQFTYNSNGSLSTVSERTVAQNGSFFTSSRSFTYSNGLVTGVS